MNLKHLLTLVLSASLILGAVLTGGCIGGGTEAPSQEIPSRIIEDVTPPEGYALIQNNLNNPDFVIMDVRTQAEFTEGHIENATNIDFYSKTFRDELDSLDKNKTYLIYCRSGGRSGKTLNIMAELSFKEVYNVLGGILQWQSEGLPTTK